MNKAAAMRRAHWVASRFLTSDLDAAEGLQCPACDDEGEGCVDCERVRTALEVIVDRHLKASGLDFITGEEAHPCQK